MSTSMLMAALLPLLSLTATAPETAGPSAGLPAAAELGALIAQDWTSFSRRIHQQDRLTHAPAEFAGVPQALCRRELPDTYECVSLVEYQLQGGTGRSSLLRHHVSRDSRGRLLDAILIRETPAPR